MHLKLVQNSLIILNGVWTLNFIHAAKVATLITLLKYYVNINGASINQLA